MQDDTTRQCPVCGAKLISADSCAELFHQAQLRELERPAYYAVHHLSVPCYMIQHNAYSREGFRRVRDLLQRFTQGLDPRHFLNTEGREMDNQQRDFSFTKGAKLPELDRIAWSFLVSDVRLDTSEHYCQDVRRWAESVLLDTAHLTR